jgi:HSP20 family molecular chaperone IbpA
MATSKPAPSGQGTTKTPRIIGETEKESFLHSLLRRVSERAYRLFESSGREHGNDHAHWLQAENEVLQHGLEIRESGSWLSINALLPDVSANDIQVYVAPNRVIVRVEQTQNIESSDSLERGLTQHELFIAQELNTEIDPSTASAAFRDQKLTLMVKKRFPESATASLKEQSDQR